MADPAKDSEDENGNNCNHNDTFQVLLAPITKSATPALHEKSLQLSFAFKLIQFCFVWFGCITLVSLIQELYVGFQRAYFEWMSLIPFVIAGSNYRFE